MSINETKKRIYYCKLHKIGTMMRRLFFVRHGQIAQEYTDRCISRTDFLLDMTGREQAVALGKWLRSHPVSAVFSSPLQRCRETAECMAHGQPVILQEALAEVGVGEWENLSFAEIRKRWPTEYAARGEHMGTAAPPGGESFAQGAERMELAIREILSDTSGDILLVTHAGILRGWLCRIAGISCDQVFSFSVPYGSITKVSFDGADFHIEYVGAKPEKIPGPEEIRFFYRKCRTPVEIQEHCRAVAQKVIELADGLALDEKLLYTAALLHDMCRTQGKEHPQKAAGLLHKAGYKELAQIVSMHHDFPEEDEPETAEEAGLLYLADKLFMGTRQVDLEERFSHSREKCKDDAAVAVWQKRYDTARRLAENYMR